MSLNAQIGARLREERERQSKTQSALAEAIGVRREMLSKYEAGAEPGASVLARAAEAGVDIAYVLTGKRYIAALKGAASSADLIDSARATAGSLTPGKTLEEASPGYLPREPHEFGSVGPLVWDRPASSALVFPVTFPDLDTTREYEVIPRMKAEASAGRGRRNAEDATLEAAGVMALDRQWMFDNFGRRGDGFATVQVHGDSMESTLFNGETIVIDTRVDRIDVSGIYVIKAGKDVLVKRVQRKFDGTLVLKSDNPAYEPETLSPAEAAQVEVQGRMVWPRVR